MKKNHNDSALYILKDLGNTPLFSFINDGISPISVNAIYTFPGGWPWLQNIF